MRISDWSSDVCSSDLYRDRQGRHLGQGLCRSHLAAPAGRADGIADGAAAQAARRARGARPLQRSEEHTSELQSLMRNSYAVSCLNKIQKHTRTADMTFTRDPINHMQHNYSGYSH